MSRLRLVCLLSLGLALPIAAQDQPTDYWSTPGSHQTDGSGKVTYDEVKNPSTFTVQVFENNAWFTYHYAPNSERLLKIDGPDLVEELLYDDHLRSAGEIVHIGSLALKMQVSGATGIVAGDMPPFTRPPDQDGHQWELLDDRGKWIARIDINPTLGVASMKLNNGLTLSMAEQHDHVFAESLTNANGRVLKKRLVDSQAWDRKSTVDLGIVRNALGLSQAWPNEVRVESSANRQLRTIKDRKGHPLVYLVKYGPDQFGFDAEGKALFYDLVLGYENGRSERPEVLGDLQSTLPSHVLVTRDGEVGAYVETPATTALSGFWSERDASGHVGFGYRFQGGDPENDAAIKAAISRANPQAP